MAREEVQLWCIFLDNGPNHPFPVKIGLDEMVCDLKEVITSKRCMREYDACDILLYKLSEPISVRPTKNLFQRIENKGDIQSFAGEVEETSYTLRDVFQEGVADHRLHLLVKLPPGEEKAPPRKRIRIDHDLSKKGDAGLLSTTTPSSLNNSKIPRSDSRVIRSRPLHANEGDRRHEIMYLLYEALWKKGEQAWTKISRIVKEHGPDPLVTPKECDLDPPEEAQVTIIDLTSLLSWTRKDVKLDLLIPILLARGEYSKLDNFLESNSDHVLLVGQPGIGKTVYLTYCLLRRLLAGLPTIFTISKRNRYVFLDSSVHWIPYDSFDMSENPPFTDPVENTLVLFDLNEAQSTPEQF